MITLNLFDEFAQFLHADLFFLDKRGDGREVGVVEVVLDDASDRPAAVLRLRDEGIVLVGIPILLVVEESLALQDADDRRERVEMRAGLSIVLLQLTDEHGAVLPLQFHDFLFLVGQFLHCFRVLSFTLHLRRISISERKVTKNFRYLQLDALVFKLI